MDDRRLLYLSLQHNREGQASYAHVHEIIAGLRKRGWDVRLFEPRYRSGNPGGLVRVWECLRTQMRLLVHLRFSNAVYIRSHFLAFPTALVLRLLRIPVVTELNGPYEDAFLSWPALKVFRTAIEASNRLRLRWSVEVVTVTPQLGEWVRRESGRDHDRDQDQDQVTVIPNGANEELFHPDAVCDVDVDQPYALFFGALAPWQGLETLVEARRCESWPSNVGLVVAGDGPLRSVVEEAARAGDVTYLGSIPYRQMPGLVAGSLCTVSAQSGIAERALIGVAPLKLYESLACGTPVVVSDIPGQAEFVRDHSCGLVVPPGDAEALAGAVARLAESVEERAAMKVHARDAIVRGNRWDDRAAATHAVLIRALRRRHRTGGPREP
ncbi:glycosyltransferase family 4 protein [Candidatus Bipolaricaulota bacterium]|nr:glycosyltransferase family 4 protein [Candidatus Bipolaricaulota bacterium]